MTERHSTVNWRGAAWLTTIVSQSDTLTTMGECMVSGLNYYDLLLLFGIWFLKFSTDTEFQIRYSFNLQIASFPLHRSQTMTHKGESMRSNLVIVGNAISLVCPLQLSIRTWYVYLQNRVYYSYMHIKQQWVRLSWRLYKQWYIANSIQTFLSPPDVKNWYSAQLANYLPSTW